MTKIDLLKKVSLFSSLTGRQLDRVARLSRYYRFGDGEIIYDEKSPCDQLFVIGKGGVRITRVLKDGSPVDLAEFIAGESFGELELLDSSTRNSIAKAQGETSLLIFPMKGVSFSDILERYPHIFARVLHRLLVLIASRIRSTNRLISERAPWVEGLRKQLLVDPLTGLYNRTYLEDEFVAPADGSVMMSLLMVKPDNFKAINDRCGHETGDRVLKLMAKALMEAIPEGAAAVRYRGDEFAAVLADCGDGEAMEYARRVKDRMSGLDIDTATAGRVDALTFSLGIVTHPPVASGDLIQTALERMFEARNSGGDRIRG
jgi:diguanylate cyclase (GGDEF)-like protein